MRLGKWSLSNKEAVLRYIELKKSLEKDNYEDVNELLVIESEILFDEIVYYIEDELSPED